MKSLNIFMKNMVIKHNFSTPKTPQKNGVIERKNRSPEELARTMLNETLLSKYFWVDAVNTTSYVLNRVLIRHILKKSPYELFKGKWPVWIHVKVTSAGRAFGSGYFCHFAPVLELRHIRMRPKR